MQFRVDYVWSSHVFLVISSSHSITRDVYIDWASASEVRMSSLSCLHGIVSASSYTSTMIIQGLPRYF